MRQIAPVIGVMQSGSAPEVIRANEKLVASLGVDVESGQVADDRAEFEQASEELTAAAESGLTVLPLYAEEAGGMLHPWKFKSMDYPSQTSYLRELAGWLSADRDVA